MFKIGMGYDIHRFAPDRSLVLGGVTIPFSQGLLGHSDADVLIHAVIDAILGALGENDIGAHFPDTDQRYKDISSMELLRAVIGLEAASGCQIGNIDSIIIAEQPKLRVYIKEMCENIASALNIDTGKVNVKATTHEKTGSLGRGEAIAAQAVVLIFQEIAL